MRIVRVLLLSLIVAAILLAVLGGCSVQQPPQSLEEKALEMYRSLMCPICAGQTIEQSQSELSVQMRAIVKEKLEQGWTKEQILQFFVERYGDSVLAAPTKKGFNLVVWLAPITGIIVGGIVIWLAIRQWTRRGKEPPLETAELTKKNADDEKYRSRLEQDLKNFDNNKGFR